jgi:hypothetical protein
MGKILVANLQDIQQCLLFPRIGDRRVVIAPIGDNSRRTEVRTFGDRKDHGDNLGSSPSSRCHMDSRLRMESPTLESQTLHAAPNQWSIP